MTITDPRLVTSGYYRNNSYVLLGLTIVAALAAWQFPSEKSLVAWLPILAAALSYASVGAWLYEQRRAGRLILAHLAITALAGTWVGVAPVALPTDMRILKWLDPLTSGAVLGMTMGAMLLGHWYLNAPGMKLKPLQRLIALMGVAIVIRAVVCAVGLVLEWQGSTPWGETRVALVALRWLAGLVGPAIMAWMSWKTLEIPNTQSATGILYVGVIGVFLGEMISTLLSSEGGYPL